jgi:hypothetical protein
MEDLLEKSERLKHKINEINYAIEEIEKEEEQDK